MTQRSLTVSPLLQQCFELTETHCVLECCGLDAFDPDPVVIHKWFHGIGETAAAQAADELRELISLAEDTTLDVHSEFLNATTVTLKARAELVAFLNAYKAAISPPR